MNIVSRQQAKAAGLTRYFTGKACYRGHVAERYTSRGNCVECSEKRVSRKKLTDLAAEAKAEGLRFYLADRPCKRGHEPWRYVSGGICVECMRERNQRNVNTRAEYARKNAPAIAERAREYRQAHRDEISERQHYYSKAYPEKNRAKTAKYRAAKTDRLPAWYSDQDRQHEELLHTACKAMLQIFGEVWHVDHVYPLQGRKVSGLHCADNLQLLSEHDNTSKNNKHPDDWVKPPVDLRKYHVL